MNDETGQDRLLMSKLCTLPEGWRVLRLGDVAEQRRETVNPEDGEWKYVGLGHMDPGESRLKRFGFSSEIHSAKSKFYLGDILYGKLRPYLDKGALADFEGICSTDIIVLRPKENLDKTFLSYLVHLNSFREYATTTMTGVNHPRTSWGVLSKFLVPLPPLPEQKKIAAVLSAVQEAKEKTEEVIKATKELKKSLMKHLFTYGPVPLDEAENVPLKETEIGTIPEDWELTEIGEIFDIQQGKAMSPKSRLGTSPRPFLRASNVLWGRLDLSTLDYMDFAKEELERFNLQEDDLLVCEGGEIGRTAIWHGNIGDCGYQNHIHRLRRKTTAVWPEFYMYWMQAAFLILGLYVGREIRTTIPNLSAGRLRSFVVPLPSLPEQKKIAEILSSVDQKIKVEEDRKEALDELFKTLLHNLMTAKIRVNHLELKV